MLCLVLTAAPLSVAQSGREQAEKEEETESKLTLVDDFFTSAIDSENLFATFDDFFDPNECKRLDLYELIENRDKMGNIIRKGILNEDMTVEEVKADIRRWGIVSAELYYLRNIELLEDGETQQLHSEVYEKFGDNPAITPKALDFWKKKYTRKLDDYDNCQASFKAIAKRWNKMEADIKQAGKNFREATNKAIAQAGKLSDKVIEDLEKNYDALFSEDVEFSLDEFVKYNLDFGPTDKFFGEAKKKIKRVAQKIDTNAVSLTVRENPDANLLEVTELSSDTADSFDFVFEEQLASSNDLLVAKNADRMIAAVWDQAQRTPTKFAQLKALIDEDDDKSLTSQLEALNDRQCKATE